MKTVELKAYAKINLILNVLGKRPDGYHELQSVMQAADLYDSVTVAWERQTGLYGTGPCMGACDIELCPGRPDLPSGPKNLAYKAALKMHEAFHGGVRENIKIDIVKRIPAAAGLGGGSSDAAAVIYGLACLWELERDPDTPGGRALVDIASEIGSDVPFCLGVQMGHRAALALGRGERLSFIPALECRVEIYAPPLSLSTAAVYGELRAEDYAAPYDVEGFLRAGSLEEKCRFMGNHLQAPAMRLCPQIKAEIERLSQINDGLCTLQSGSGPSIFTVFENPLP